MFDSLRNPIKFPELSSLLKYEGGGNYAISKYYRYPYRLFYRKKLYIARSLMKKDFVYRTILDFGSGPGIFTPELKQHAMAVKNYEPGVIIDKRSRFDCIVALSVMEFLENLPEEIEWLRRVSTFHTQLIVVSPMKSTLSRFYFNLIGDKRVRNSSENILSAIKKHYEILEYGEWFGLYFYIKAIAK